MLRMAIRIAITIIATSAAKPRVSTGTSSPPSARIRTPDDPVKLEKNAQTSTLANATLENANLKDADLRDADLSGTNLSGADLSHAQVSVEQLLLACGDDRTLLPASIELELPACF